MVLTLVAAVVDVEGYATTISPPGKDGGVGLLLPCGSTLGSNFNLQFKLKVF
ncbi:hypothetical protein C8K15_12710 [Paenisporosarcina sp. OV554]|nr:hypothetical protein C8K15_12710 [Paenisporosarcina sp. OV554]